MRDPALQAVEMGEEFVMMGLAQGEYYAVKGVAAALWRHLEQPRDLGELCALVAADYDVSAEACRDDIVAFLDELRGRRMVHTAS
ncbi:PqqD family protein [Nocardioides sp. L-11A]|uniref:PqqD family protein n=1 Tax=Nocardioides sp. L-11A TaxID=3043848 RepID=UPI00249BAF36|nr:PqqD family protein [Nocardioides sp. L-11A]